MPESCNENHGPEGGIPPRVCMNVVLCLGFCVLAGGIVMILLSGYSQYYNNRSNSDPTTTESTLRVFGYALVCSGGVIMLKAAILFILEHRLFPNVAAAVVSSASELGNAELPDRFRPNPWTRIQTYHLCYPDFATATPTPPRYCQLGGNDIYESGILTPAFEPRYWDPPPPYPGKSTLT